MKIEQIYTGCLAQGAYYIESDGEAAVIDPLRETEPYLKRAAGNGAKIKYIFETHFHADFVSGHVDLAKKSGATIVYGPSAKTAYNIHEATDGEILKLGKVKIKVLHTPGHTPESTSFLLMDENDKPHAIFTGDTLFIGDVGRPDLAQKATGLTQEDLAGWLFDSLRSKIMTLPDEVIVYPAHGAGSACGKNMSRETWDTVGHQKQVNYALRLNMTRTEFIREVTEGLQPPPAYFAQNAMMNKVGYQNIDAVMAKGAQPLTPQQLEDIVNQEDALVLDVRKRDDFAKAFIPNSIYIGLDGSFAPWVGALIPDLKQNIVIVAPEGREEETVKRLARVGFDNCLGYLKGGIESWKAAGKETDSIRTVSAAELENSWKKDPSIQILDVRKPGEWAAKHLEMAQHFPLDFISEYMHEVDKNKTYFVHCQGGYRSMIATSILKARGFNNVIDVESGFAAIQKTGLPRTDFVCQSSR